MESTWRAFMKRNTNCEYDSLICARAHCTTRKATSGQILQYISQGDFAVTLLQRMWPPLAVMQATQMRCLLCTRHHMACWGIPSHSSSSASVSSCLFVVSDPFDTCASEVQRGSDQVNKASRDWPRQRWWGHRRC